MSKVSVGTHRRGGSLGKSSRRGGKGTTMGKVKIISGYDSREENHPVTQDDIYELIRRGIERKLQHEGKTEDR